MDWKAATVKEILSKFQTGKMVLFRDKTEPDVFGWGELILIWYCLDAIAFSIKLPNDKIIILMPELGDRVIPYE